MAILSIKERIEAMPEQHRWNIYIAWLLAYFTERHLGPRALHGNQPEPKSFPQFCSPRLVVIGPGWEEQGYAAERWLDWPMDSLGYWITRDKRYAV